MEPRSFKRGNLQSLFEIAWEKAEASMEPRSFKRGNDGVPANVTNKIGASMEPRSFKRGNTRW